MYRAVTLYCVRHGIGPDAYNLADTLQALRIRLVPSEHGEENQVYVNGEEVTRELRTPEVSARVSDFAAVSEVRRKLVEQQRQMGEAKGVVMDGRDIGTVVFPDAELKVFLTADPNVRAYRRQQELARRGRQLTFEEVLADLRNRDEIDSSRQDSPLRKAKDARELDTTNLSIPQQIDTVVSWARQLIPATPG